MAVDRDDWLGHIRDVIRSRHYTWLPEGLAGQTPEVAMTWLVTDIMHVCQRTGVDWETVAKHAHEQFRREESQVSAEQKPDSQAS